MRRIQRIHKTQTSIQLFILLIFAVHKDPYENIYCVVTGKKNFILHPPTDLPWIPYQNYPSAVYKERESGKWTIEPIVDETLDSGQTANSSILTPWICIDPLKPDYEKFSTHMAQHCFLDNTCSRKKLAK